MTSWVWLAALAGPEVSVEPIEAVVGECFEARITLRNPGTADMEVALGSNAVEVLLDAPRPRPLVLVPGPECGSHGPRIVLEPGETVEWTFRRQPFFLPRQITTVDLEIQDAGRVTVPITVEVPETFTVEWYSARREEPGDFRFQHPRHVPALAALARQGVVWPVRTLARVPDAAGVADILEELRDHPLKDVRLAAALRVYPSTDPQDLIPELTGSNHPSLWILDGLASAGMLDGPLAPELAEIVGMDRLDGELLLQRIEDSPGDVGGRRLEAMLFQFAPPLSDVRLLEILERTGSTEVAGVVVLALDRRVPEALPVLYDRLERCEDPFLLAYTRGWAFDVGERDVVAPMLLQCLDIEAVREPTAAGLLHYVAWGRAPSPCTDFDPAAARAAWETVFSMHSEAIAMGRQLPTYAEGVPEAAKSLGCRVHPSSLP